MKSTLLKYLPMAAALTIATACSNDDENIIVPQPVLEAESVQPEFVKVPITLAVDNGTKSLLKIGSSSINESGKEKLKFSFDDDDISKHHLVALVNDDEEDEDDCYLVDQYQYLTLEKNTKGEFVFTGELSVKSDKSVSYDAGDCWLSVYLMEEADLTDMQNRGLTIQDYTSSWIAESSLDNLVYKPGVFRASLFPNTPGSDRISFRADDYTFFYIENPVNAISVSIDGKSNEVDLSINHWFAAKTNLASYIESVDLGLDKDANGKPIYISPNTIYRIIRN